MPLFKILDAKRSRKGLIRATNLAEIIAQATEKLNLLGDTEYKIVEEEDGSEIFDDQVLLERSNQCSELKQNLKLMVLPINMNWSREIIVLAENVNPNIGTDASSSEDLALGPEVGASTVNTINLERDIMSEIIKKVPERIIQYCSKNKSPLPADIRLMNAQIASYAIQNLKDSSRGTAYSIAFMLCNKYPLLADSVKGQTLGKGFETLGMRIYNAINVRKDSDDKKRKAGPHPLFDTDQEEEKGRSVSRRQDQYGCMEYQTNVPEEDFAILEEKRLQLFTLYSNSEQRDIEKITTLLNELFYLLRQMINAENRCVLTVVMQYPFLGESKYFVEHATRVIYGKEGRSGETLNKIWQKNMTTTVPAMKQYFKSLYLISETKKKKSKNDPILKDIYTMILDAEALCVKTKDEIPNSISMFKILLAYLQENEEFLIQVLEGSTTDLETMELASSVYPTVMIRGTSVFDTNAVVCVVLEKKVLIKADDVLDGIKITFASYYVFGYAYPTELAKSLEFMQRFIFEINPPTIVDKREKGAKRRLKSFDSTVKKLMTDLEKIIKTV